MFMSSLLGISLGIVAGTISGLIPGVHINLITLLLLTLEWKINPMVVSMFLIAMGVTHTFLDSIPTIFLGVPDSDTALGVLPGHKFVLKGYGYYAIKLTLIGSFIGLLISLAMAPISIMIIRKFYYLIKPILGYILLVMVMIMIFQEKRKLVSLLVFLMSGVLGVIVFGIYKVNQPLLPLLTGLFGLSNLLISLNRDVKVPKQRLISFVGLSKRSIISLFMGSFFGCFSSLFPGIGPSHGAVLASVIMGKLHSVEWLVLIGSVNTASIVFSILVLYGLNKARNGLMVGISRLIEMDYYMVVLFLCVGLIAGCVAVIIGLMVGRVFAKIIPKINYRVLCLSVIIFVIFLVYYFSSFVGLLILITATMIGIIPQLMHVRRVHAMGCILLPVIIFFL